MAVITPRYPSTSPVYQEALDWLYSFINTEKKLPTSRADYNLPRTAALLRLLGNPQQRYPSVMIAGTKGKGSTAAMIESMLRASGLRTGLYTSPHLHSYRERMQIDRVPVSQQRLAELVDGLKPIVLDLDPALGRPSVFELTTALALSYFAAEQIGCAVLEVGLGGRFDSVNVLKPLVSVIASISLDHRQILGETLEAIAFEKAGIIKPGVPVVTVPQQPEAAAVLAKVATEQGAPLFVATPEGLCREEDEKPTPYAVSIAPDTVGLRGAVQLENARLAVSTAQLLREQRLAIPDSALAKGLAEVSWPARLEVLREQPLVIADGAHNGDSAGKLAGALRELFRFERLILVLGTLADKEIGAIVEALVPQADAVVLTRAPRHPRAAEVDRLAAVVVPYARGPMLTTSDVPPAIDEALRLAQPDDLICVTGSLSVAAVAREVFGLAEPD